MATRTRSFGAGNRESHDAAPFYERFTAPELSDDDTVNPCRVADSIICGDARDMQAVDDCSVALVVTSPPYAGNGSSGSAPTCRCRWLCLGMTVVR